MSFADLARNKNPPESNDLIQNINSRRRGSGALKQQQRDPLTETATLKLEQYERQVGIIVRRANAPTFEESQDLQDRIKYACLLQEEVAVALAKMPNENAIQKRRICRGFDNISKQLETSVKKITAKEQEYQEELLGKQEDDKKTLKVEHGGDVLEFRQLEDEIAFNEALIEERGKDIERIHQSVHQVNEIFQDLATIVQEQQQTIDDIESHVQESHARTEQGLEQVKKASEMQSSCLIM